MKLKLPSNETVTIDEAADLVPEIDVREKRIELLREDVKFLKAKARQLKAWPIESPEPADAPEKASK